MNPSEQTLNEAVEYDAKCPSCSSSIKFNPSNGKLTCSYCSYEEMIPQPQLDMDKVAQELDFNAEINRGNFDWGAEKKVVICDACAAESVYDALEVANICPYCGSNHVMESYNEQSLAPNGVCPFKITKEQADANFHSWIKGKWFAPNEAKRSAKADAFKGVYLPYWTFDTKTASQYTASYGKHRIVRDSEGKERTVTDWYSTSGFYQEFIDDYLIRATTRYNDDILRSVEPFNTSDNRTYNQDYLSGYVAERYSIGLEDGWKQAQQGIHHHIHAQIDMQIRRRYHADVVSNIHFSTVHSNITYKYLLLPIWLSSFRFKSKTYQFMVNGQTGKVGGQSPISAIKVTIAVLAFLAIIAVLYLYNEGTIF